MSGRGVFFVLFGKVAVHFLAEGVEAGMARLFHAAEGPEVKEHQDEDEAAVDEKADVLEGAGCFVHDDACKEHGGYSDEYGDGILAGEVAAAQVHGYKCGDPVLGGGCADLCAGLGKKVACNDEELCNVVFQGHEGDEENQGEE